MKNELSFNEMALLWLADKSAYVKRSTLSIYSVHLHKHLIPAFGHLTSVSESDVQAFVNGRLATGLCQKTVKDIVVVLVMILRYAAKYYAWEFRPMDIRYPPIRMNPSLQVFTISQQRRLMQYLSQNVSPYNVGIALCLGTGMRIGEICALTWEDLDLKSGLVRVSKTLQRIYLGSHHSEVVIGTPKTRYSYREIPLSASLVTLLRPLKQTARPQDYILTGGPKPTEPGPYRAYFQRLLSNLGFPSIRFHGLRHSFATRCIEYKCDYKTVSALLGHANISTTLNLYVHPGLAQKKKCVNRAARGLM